MTAFGAAAKAVVRIMIPPAARMRLREILDRIRYPYLRITEMPADRPSLNSIYFLINQLGKHQPVGLTHEAATAYHELPFPELKVKTSRKDLPDRVNRIREALEIEGKYGIDLGCAVGGLTFSLQQLGARMMGVDRDLPSIQVARECEAYFRTGAEFRHQDIGPPLLEHIGANHVNPATGRLDFTLWFSSFNWVLKDLGTERTIEFLKTLSSQCDHLVMDSAIGGKAQDAMSAAGIENNRDFERFIVANTLYESGTSIGRDSGWYGREVFLFK